MKTVATVVELRGRIAVVETDRVSACEGCHKAAPGQTCSVCTLMGSGKRSVRSQADNGIGAAVGDRVEVETSSRRILLYAALVFLVPMLAAAAGGWILWALTRQTVFAAIGAAAGLAIAFAAVRIYSVRVGKRRPDAVITGILSRSGQEAPDPGTKD